MRKKNFYWLFFSFFGLSLPTFGVNSSVTVICLQGTPQPLQCIFIQYISPEGPNMGLPPSIPNGQNTLTTTVSSPASKGSNPSYECDVCHKQIKGKWNLKQHKKIHTGERPFGCNYCGKRFIVKRRMTEHIRIHTGEKPFKCKYCKKGFTVKHNMKTHLNIHTGKKPYQCKECSKKYASPGGLNSHKKRRHNGR